LSKCLSFPFDVLQVFDEGFLDRYDGEVLKKCSSAALSSPSASSSSFLLVPPQFPFVYHSHIPLFWVLQEMVGIVITA
jgi:hypothetical protein